MDNMDNKDKDMNKSMCKGVQLFVKSINGKTFSFFVNNNETF